MLKIAESNPNSSRDPYQPAVRMHRMQFVICNYSVIYAIIVIYHILRQSVPPLGVSPALHIFEDSQEECVCIHHFYESVDFNQ